VHAFDEDSIVKDHTEKMDVLINALEDDGVKFGDDADAGEVLDAIESRGVSDDSKWFGTQVIVTMPRLDNGHYVYRVHEYVPGEIDECLYIWNYVGPGAKEYLKAMFFTCGLDTEWNVLVETATTKYPPSSGGGGIF
jgi:hypothetical protein